MESILDTLRATPIFGRLPADDLMRLASQVRPRKLVVDELVFREGEPCHGFYIVAEGGVRVYKISPDGRERTLHVMRPPHAFAEAAMFLPGGYPAFAVALEPSRVLMVPKAAFQSLLSSRPETAMSVFASLSTWLHRLLDQLENQTFLTARAKLAIFLAREAAHQGIATGPASLQLPDAKKTIASQLGMSPETLSRGLAELETRGLIRVDGKRVELTDVDALRTAALAGGES